jgi:hypothetical protein
VPIDLFDDAQCTPALVKLWMAETEDAQVRLALKVLLAAIEDGDEEARILAVGALADRIILEQGVWS